MMIPPEDRPVEAMKQKQKCTESSYEEWEPKGDLSHKGKVSPLVFEGPNQSLLRVFVV